MAKILLADDDYNMVSLLKTLLGLEGYQVTTLMDKNGDILDNIRKDAPDILIMDINLGDRNGMDIVRQIRQSVDLTKLYVIMASGFDKASDCKAAGADDFLLKPYMPADLLKILSQHLSKTNE